MPSPDSILTQSYVITLADLNIPPQNKPTQPCASFCEKWTSKGSCELLACLQPCDEPEGTACRVPWHRRPRRAKVDWAGSSGKMFWRGRNLTCGSDAQQQPAGLSAFTSRAELTVRLVKTTNLSGLRSHAQPSCSSGGRRRKARQTDFIEEMFTNCDFSATDRAALFQKATMLTETLLKQAHGETLLEKGHV